MDTTPNIMLAALVTAACSMNRRASKIRGWALDCTATSQSRSEAQTARIGGYGISQGPQVGILRVLPGHPAFSLQRDTAKPLALHARSVRTRRQLYKPIT